MVDLEKAKKEFLKFTEKYNLENEDLKRKQLHSLRVMERSKELAEKLELDEEKKEIAQLIGLLHDIGRFEQYSRNEIHLNEMLLDHSKLGIEILLKDNYIKNYIDDEYYIAIILKAIKNHNKYKIEDDLNKEELLFTKIIRDADKLDILYEGVNIYWKTEREKKSIENSLINIKVEQQVSAEIQVKKMGNERNDTVDGVLILLSFIFDINFKETLKIIYDENFIDDILKRFDFKNEVTKEKISKIRKMLQIFIRKEYKKKKLEG